MRGVLAPAAAADAAGPRPLDELWKQAGARRVVVWRGGKLGDAEARRLLANQGGKR